MTVYSSETCATFPFYLKDNIIVNSDFPQQILIYKWYFQQKNGVNKRLKLILYAQTIIFSSLQYICKRLEP